MTVALAVAALLVLASTVLWVARSAIQRISTARAGRLVDDERAGADRLLSLVADADRTWSTLTILIVLLSSTGIAVGVLALAEVLVPAAAVAVVVGVTLVQHVVTASLTRPRVLHHPEDLACRLASTAFVLTRVAAPLGFVFGWLNRAGADGQAEVETTVTEEAIRDLIDEAEGQTIEPAERAMIDAIFELSDTLVREIMVPRPDVVMVSDLLGLGDVVQTILDHGYSRIPVHRGEDRDEIAGVLYAKDVLQQLHLNGSEDGEWTELIREPYVVPELKSVDGLLTELQSEKVHMALVVDEYGALAGIVTIEDVLEEIVGEIVDEYDSEEALVRMLEPGRWQVDARLPVSDLEELADTDLPDDDWDTVGGLLYGLLGHVPRTGESVRVDGLRLRAERVRGRRIAEVLVEQVPVEDDEAADGADAPGGTAGARVPDEATS